ncbi:MAG: OB-fold domain-containing protein [Chloroflexi bacterium]|nr:OB-fold domain-containing protein [Chloroflexota bacterium]
MAEDAATRPLPEADEASKPFFDGAMLGKLMLMKCADCGAMRIPSRQHCDVCLSANTDWVEASGRGVVRTFGVMHRQYHPAFTVPYNLAFVELEEGPRIVTNIVGIGDADIRVGMPVVVDWERHEDVAVPNFRPA